jgi:hypothetical protein
MLAPSSYWNTTWVISASLTVIGAWLESAWVSEDASL